MRSNFRQKWLTQILVFPQRYQKEIIDLYFMCKIINKTDSSCMSAWPTVALLLPHVGEEFAVVLTVQCKRGFTTSRPRWLSSMSRYSNSSQPCCSAARIAQTAHFSIGSLSQHVCLALPDSRRATLDTWHMSRSPRWLWGWDWLLSDQLPTLPKAHGNAKWFDTHFVHQNTIQFPRREGEQSAVQVIETDKASTRLSGLSK
jgi:hypothetical protein